MENDAERSCVLSENEHSLETTIAIVTIAIFVLEAITSILFTWKD